MKTHQQKWKKGIQKNWIENFTELIELANRNRRCAETTPDYHWHDNVGCSSAATKYGKLEMRRSQHTSTSSYGLLFVQHKIWFLAASIRWWMLFMLVLLNAQRCALCFSLSHWLPFPASIQKYVADLPSRINIHTKMTTRLFPSLSHYNQTHRCRTLSHWHTACTERFHFIGANEDEHRLPSFMIKVFVFNVCSCSGLEL